MHIKIIMLKRDGVCFDYMKRINVGLDRAGLRKLRWSWDM